MDRSAALQVIKRLSKEEFDEKIKCQKLVDDRRDLLFSFIKGEVDIRYSCKTDLEEYALKHLMPDVYEALPHDGHYYSTGELYEYDPSKNGQNIIKHGLGFGDVVSYSTQFGTLIVPSLSCSFAMNFRKV